MWETQCNLKAKDSSSILKEYIYSIKILFSMNSILCFFGKLSETSLVFPTIELASYFQTQSAGAIRLDSSSKTNSTVVTNHVAGKI